MALSPGTRLGHYDVTALLGEGGMGQVWQARDTQLNRAVALKILPDTFAADPDRLARFKREAQILASLNHPNIAAIYGIEEGDDTRALVLELVEGPTLADRIAHGAMPIEDALPIAKQIAEALEAAHEAGVIHRDLKPANIKVREDGTVKVLDFGLAKALNATPAGDPSQSPTLTDMASQAGVILGTAAYMSPEQARGEPVNKRADVWAFGVVFYEMMTGRRPFEGRTVSDTLASVLARDPDLDALPTNTPPAVHRLLRRCFEKEPTKRLRDVAEGVLQLEDGLATPPPPVAPDTASRQVQLWQQPLSIALIVLLVAMGTGLTMWSLMGPGGTTSLPLRRFAIDLGPARPIPVANVHAMPAWSPDGTQLVYAANLSGTTQLYVRDLDQLDARPIAGTENAFEPFFSPDGEWVGFYTPSGIGSGELKRVAVRGGTPLTLCECFPPAGATWLADGTIILTHAPTEVTAPILVRIPETGGTPEPLTTLDLESGESAHFWPHALPGGTAVLFTILGELDTDTSRVAVLSLDTGEQHVVVEGGFNARYVSTGHLVFGRQGALWGVPFDLDLLATTGPEEVLVQGIEVNELYGSMALAASGDGSLVYVRGGAAGTVGETRTLVWVDREGREEPIAMPPRPYFAARLSPDGTRVAVEVRDENTDIWVHNLARGTQTRLTFDPGLDRFPVWTPDGEHIAFSSDRTGVGLYDVFWKLAVGTGQPELVVTDPDRRLDAWSWTPDGQSLLLNEAGLDIGIVTLDGDRTRQPVLEEAFQEGSPEVSPDGRWMAYRSAESGRLEIFVRPFPDVDGGKWQVSTEGGNYPAWSPDGRELFYRTLDGAAVMGVTVETEPTFRVGIPVARVQGDYVYSAGNGRNWDISPDGQRFLMLKNVGQRATEDAPPPPTLTVVLNWFEELTERVPIN